MRALAGPDRAVYIGFAVADGRPKIVATEASVAALFVVIAAAAVTGPAWLIVIGFTGHGLKDLRQHRHHYVANTRWWPPFCLVVDWVAAAILVVLIATASTSTPSHARVDDPGCCPLEGVRPAG